MMSADFVAERSASIIITNGQTDGRIPAYVVPDVIPELAEKFSMRLSSVVLVDSDFISNPNFVPLLGNVTTATVMIAANQDPHGLFTLHIRDDNGTLQRDVVVMATNPGRSVQLYLQRLGEPVFILFLIGWISPYSDMTVQWVFHYALLCFYVLSTMLWWINFFIKGNTFCKSK